MLTKRQKEEFVKDGLSSSRRQNLASAQKIRPLSRRSLDELLKFLKDIEQFSSPEFLLPKKEFPRANKL